MVTTQYDICNMALSEIGTQSTISSFTDGSNEAIQCGLWYDTLRKRLLRAAQWGFARTQATLAQVADAIPDNTSPYPYLFSYTYPSDCLKLRYILATPITTNGAPPPDLLVSPSAWYTPSRSNRFIVANQVISTVQTKVILTNVGWVNVSPNNGAIGVYTQDVTNVALFDELFIGALASALAFKLCIPLSGNVGMRDSFAKAAQDAIDQARAADGNEAIPSGDVRVDWMEGRGIGSPFGYGFTGINGSAWGQCWGGYDNMNWGS